GCQTRPSHWPPPANRRPGLPALPPTPGPKHVRANNPTQPLQGQPRPARACPSAASCTLSPLAPTHDERSRRSGASSPRRSAAVRSPWRVLLVWLQCNTLHGASPILVPSRASVGQDVVEPVAFIVDGLWPGEGGKRAQ